MTRTKKPKSNPKRPKVDVPEKYIRHGKPGSIGWRLGWYVTTPRAVNYLALKPAGREVYKAMYALSDNSGRVKASHAAIAEETGLTPRRVQQWPDRLEELGLVEIVRRSHDRVTPNTYQIVYPQGWPEERWKEAAKVLAGRQKRWARTGAAEWEIVSRNGHEGRAQKPQTPKPKKTRLRNDEFTLKPGQKPEW